MALITEKFTVGLFLALRGEISGRFGIEVHTHYLMGRHCYLAIPNPLASKLLCDMLENGLKRISIAEGGRLSGR